MWNAAQYLKFGDERTQPCHDLVARVLLNDVQRVMDLGCGPGNSTQVLRSRWPNADITGLDNSPEMISTARNGHPEQRWVLSDIWEWAKSAKEEYDLVFSNAALHWVPDHPTIYPRLLQRSNGALAVQVPGNLTAPAQRLMRELALKPRWRELLRDARNWYVHEPEFYYDLLSPIASRIDVWTTEYIHVVKDAEAIVDWYKGSALRFYVDILPTSQDREQFCAEYLAGIREHYPARPDGRVLFPFRRIFLVAYR